MNSLQKSDLGSSLPRLPLALTFLNQSQMHFKLGLPICPAFTELGSFAILLLKILYYIIQVPRLEIFTVFNSSLAQFITYVYRVPKSLLLSTSRAIILITGFIISSLKHSNLQTGLPSSTLISSIVLPFEHLTLVLKIPTVQ